MTHRVVHSRLDAPQSVCHAGTVTPRPVRLPRLVRYNYLTEKMIPGNNLDNIVRQMELSFSISALDSTHLSNFIRWVAHYEAITDRYNLKSANRFFSGHVCAVFLEVVCIRIKPLYGVDICIHCRRSLCYRSLTRTPGKEKSIYDTQRHAHNTKKPDTVPFLRKVTIGSFDCLPSEWRVDHTEKHTSIRPNGMGAHCSTTNTHVN